MVLWYAQNKKNMFLQEPQMEAVKSHLISLVKEKRALWVNNHNSYKNKALKTNDWQSIFEKMKVCALRIIFSSLSLTVKLQDKYGDFLKKHKKSSPEDMRKMWHSLRDYYRTLLHKVSGPGTSGKGANGKIPQNHNFVIVLWCLQKKSFISQIILNGHTSAKWSFFGQPS